MSNSGKKQENNMFKVDVLLAPLLFKNTEMYIENLSD